MRMTEQATPTGPYAFAMDNGEVDTIRWRDKDGQWQSRPIAASEQEKRDAEAAALRRELAGIEHRLQHLDDPLPPGQFEVPNRETVERVRTDLENTRLAVLARLETLGDKPEPEPAKKRNR